MVVCDDFFNYNMVSPVKRPYSRRVSLYNLCSSNYVEVIGSKVFARARSESKNGNFFHIYSVTMCMFNCITVSTVYFNYVCKILYEELLYET